jgi:hypothetical protein
VPVLADQSQTNGDGNEPTEGGEARESTKLSLPGKNPDCRGGGQNSFKQVSKAKRAVPEIHGTSPHSDEAEKGIVCGMLNSPATVIPIAQQFLCCDHFHSPQNRHLFEHI